MLDPVQRQTKLRASYGIDRHQRWVREPFIKVLDDDPRIIKNEIAIDEGWQTGGKYGSDDACGNCFIDCTVIYDRPNAYGQCEASGTPYCEMACCSVGRGVT